jgi:hypothetical protein
MPERFEMASIFYREKHHRPFDIKAIFNERTVVLPAVTRFVQPLHALPAQFPGIAHPA